MRAIQDSPLANAAFRTLFAAQVCSLLAVGLMTVGMSLAAYRIGGVTAAGQILGLLLAVKMIAYVGFAPFAEALFAGRSRKAVMIGLNALRMLLLLPMAFATEAWHIAAFAFLFFAASSGFTPIFQAVIPDVLPDERDYSRALVWSRLAYTLEAMLSPVLAAIALKVVAAEFLFWVAALAFAASILALVSVRLVKQKDGSRMGPFLSRSLRGLNIYRKTPRLRGLIALNFALSLSMAWVLVNSVVVASAQLGDAERFFPILMAFYGLGAVVGALGVPKLLAILDERRVMLLGTAAHGVFGLGILLPLGHAGYMGLWILFGLTASLVLTPGGLVVARSAGPANRPALFAAQFSLSHAGWLVAYPVAGELAARIGLEQALVLLSGLSLTLAAVAARIWPARDPLVREHDHPDLPLDHPHLRTSPGQQPTHRHEHVFHIDEIHPEWSVSRPA